MRTFVIAFGVTAVALTAGVLIAAGPASYDSPDVCTEADGACLTWDDIREQPIHHQED